MADAVVEVVITAADADWLAAFTRALVVDRLCACGHLVPSVRSIYRWHGEVHDESEARVALHTRAALVPRIVDRVASEHAYDVPCVIALPVTDGSADYLDWVRAESQPD